MSSGGEPAETPKERADRNYDDLLQELRVSQNGTQILFAFLLTVPFSNGFSKVTSAQRAIYFTTLMLAAASAALLIAPAVMHRVLFRQHRKEALLRVAGKAALGGQTLLAFAVAGSVLLIADYLYGVAAGIVAAAGIGGWWLLWFFAVPIGVRKHAPEDS